MFFNTCDYQAKKEALRALARLSEENCFEKAACALQTALEHGTGDADSIVATFSRLNSQVIELDPLVLSGTVPELPPVESRASHYDQLFLEGGGLYEN